MSGYKQDTEDPGPKRWAAGIMLAILLVIGGVLYKNGTFDQLLHPPAKTGS